MKSKQRKKQGRKPAWWPKLSDEFVQLKNNGLISLWAIKERGDGTASAICSSDGEPYSLTEEVVLKALKTHRVSRADFFRAFQRHAFTTSQAFYYENKN